MHLCIYACGAVSTVDRRIYRCTHSCMAIHSFLVVRRHPPPLPTWCGPLSFSPKYGFHLIPFSIPPCRLPNVRLALVGGGPDSEPLKEHFKGTRTVLTGQMTGEALSQAFASADVFVMPSETETLGFVVLESMASGVPVVGADAGGIPDLIDDGKVRRF